VGTRTGRLSGTALPRGNGWYGSETAAQRPGSSFVTCRGWIQQTDGLERSSKTLRPRAMLAASPLNSSTPSFSILHLTHIQSLIEAVLCQPDGRQVPASR
jgi:hypothetical protein